MLIVEGPTARVVEAEAQEVSVLSKALLREGYLGKGQVQALKKSTLIVGPTKISVKVSYPNSHFA